MRYMLDTNILIYVIKNEPQRVLERLKMHDPSEVCVSLITYAELMYGVEKSKMKYEKCQAHSKYSAHVICAHKSLHRSWLNRLHSPALVLL